MFSPARSPGMQGREVARADRNSTHGTLSQAGPGLAANHSIFSISTSLTFGSPGSTRATPELFFASPRSPD
jgi:hypothetical protein